MPAGESSHGANPLRKQKVEVCKNIVEEHFMDWCNKNEKNQPEVKLMERRGTSVKHGGAALMGF